MSSKSSKNPAYLKAAVQAASKAGALLMKSYGKLKNSQIRSKSLNDFVTELDKKSEDLIISAIRRQFPGHAFLAEESGANSGKDVTWIIDPLDGTSNYIHQIPLFAVSIAAYENKELKAGVVYDPLHREYFTAEKGQGAFLNKKRIYASKTARLADAVMATGIPFRARDRFKDYMTSLEQISLASAGMRRGGSAAIDLAYVACGRFDGFWEIDLAPWDVAAGALLIREAGGLITDMWGRQDFMKSCDILSGNKSIHPEALQITSRVFKPHTKQWLFG